MRGKPEDALKAPVLGVGLASHVPHAGHQISHKGDHVHEDEYIAGNADRNGPLRLHALIAALYTFGGC